jgi:hypothetical protein
METFWRLGRLIMQHLNTLTQLVNAASTVVELARASQTYIFQVASSATCYIHVSSGDVQVARQSAPQIEIIAQLQAPFAWRVAAEQDDAGVYLVALRRPFVGAMGSASFLITVPEDAYLALRLEHCRLSLADVNGLIELPPQITVLQLVAQTS